MLTKKQTSMSIALVGMAVLATVMTTSISFAMPVAALGHEPNGMADFSGHPIDDKTIGLEGLLDKALGGGDATTGAFPNDEMNGANTPEVEGSEEAAAEGSDSMDSEGVGYESFQKCLPDNGGEESPTEQQVQDCFESSYGGKDSTGNTPTESEDDGDEGNSDVTEHVSSDDTEDEDDDDEDGYE
jgi:hypothetical protein